MVFSEERAQFTSVKAVDRYYPLRGRLIAGDQPFARGAPVDAGPAPGEVWIESRLFPSLDVAPGRSAGRGCLQYSCYPGADKRA